MDLDREQIINQLVENQEIYTQHNTTLEYLLSESIQLRKEHLEQVLQFEQSARQQVDKYNQLLKENEILKGLNIQIKNDSEAALRQDVTNTKNLFQKLQVKEVELIQLRQSQATLSETLKDVQNHDEIQMLELDKSERLFNDLQRTNQELLQKLNDSSSSQSYFKNTYEFLKFQNSQKDIQLIQLNKDLLVKEADIDILNNQIQKINQDKQENITLKVQIYSQQKQNEILLIELEKSEQSFINLQGIYQVHKLNAECCQGKSDKNIQNLECFNNQLKKELLAKEAQFREIMDDHQIQKNKNSILKDKIKQMDQLNQQIIASLQQIEMDPPFRSQGQYELVSEIQQQQAPIPPNIIVGPDDSLLSFQFLSSQQVIPPVQQFMMRPPSGSQGPSFELDSQILIIPDEDDDLFEILQQQVPLRPTKIPRKQNRIFRSMNVKVVKKIKKNFLD